MGTIHDSSVDIVSPRLPFATQTKDVQVETSVFHFICIVAILYS